MFFFAHLFAGLIIGKIFGNYLIALMGALLIDLDHLIVYAKHGILLSPKKFWKTITNPLDSLGYQRNFLHSFFAWIIISIIIFLVDFRIGIIFSLAYLSHLFLDALDNSDFYPFYPWKKFNIRGPIKYFSMQEWIVTLILLIVFILI